MPPKYTPEKQIEVFWSRVNKDGSIPTHMPHLGKCWEWTAGLVDGYGVTKWNGRGEKSHRISWLISCGNVPNDLCVLHKCDNRKCVNPLHLFLGTKKDNAQDMWAKGRSNHSKGHKLPPKSKETLQRVRIANKARGKIDYQIANEIRQRYAAGGISQRKLAVEYGVIQQTISFVVRGITWTD